MKEMLQKAIEFAVRVHAGQLRDGPDALPYVTHCFEVLTNLHAVGGVTNLEMLCAAMLHDAVESGGATEADIELQFGAVVADLVRQLTRTEPTVTECEGLSADAIKQLRSDLLLADIGSMTPAAQAIKLADRLANLRDAKRLKTKRSLGRYLIQTRAILKTIPRRVNKPLWTAIRERCDE